MRNVRLLMAGLGVALAVTLANAQTNLEPVAVSVVSLSIGQTAPGSLVIEATTSGMSTQKVDFLLDGALFRTDGAAPWCFAGDAADQPCTSWDSRSVANGMHTVKAVAHDATGPKAESLVTLTIANTAATNVAPQATVAVSSENASTGQLGVKAVDGVADGCTAANGCTAAHYQHEWAAVGQLAGAWIRLTWSQPQQVSQIRLFDRPNLADNVRSALVTFSDGSALSIGALPDGGAPLTVSFPARTVTSLTLTVESAVGFNTGLAELEVYGAASPTPTPPTPTSTQLLWDAPTSGPAVVEYNVYISTNGTTFNLAGVSATTEILLSTLGLTPGAAYYAYVTSVGDTGWSRFPPARSASNTRGEPRLEEEPRSVGGRQAQVAPAGSGAAA